VSKFNSDGSGAERKAVVETLTVPELLGLLSTLGLSPKGRASFGILRSKLLETLLEALDAQPVHSCQTKASTSSKPLNLGLPTNRTLSANCTAACLPKAFDYCSSRDFFF
jgi:hypothetical protein